MVLVIVFDLNHWTHLETRQQKLQNELSWEC